MDDQLIITESKIEFHGHLLIRLNTTYKGEKWSSTELRYNNEVEWQALKKHVYEIFKNDVINGIDCLKPEQK